MNDITNFLQEKFSIIKDINERKDIITKYNLIGFLDRKDAIEKIQKLRISDQEVREITSVLMIKNSIPFKEASDELLINELEMQINILQDKLLILPDQDS